MKLSAEQKFKAFSNPPLWIEISSKLNENFNYNDDVNKKLLFPAKPFPILMARTKVSVSMFFRLLRSVSFRRERIIVKKLLCKGFSSESSKLWIIKIYAVQSFCVSCCSSAASIDNDVENMIRRTATNFCAIIVIEANIVKIFFSFPIDFSKRKESKRFESDPRKIKFLRRRWVSWWRKKQKQTNGSWDERSEDEIIEQWPALEPLIVICMSVT